MYISPIFELGSFFISFFCNEYKMALAHQQKKKTKRNN